MNFQFVGLARGFQNRDGYETPGQASTNGANLSEDKPSRAVLCASRSEMLAFVVAFCNTFLRQKKVLIKNPIKI